MLVHLPDGKRLPLPEINGYMQGSFSSDGRYLAASGYPPGSNDLRFLIYDTQEEKVLGQADSASPLISMCGDRPLVIVWRGAFHAIDLEATPDFEEQWQRIKSKPIQAGKVQFGNRDQTIVGASGHFTLDLTTGKFRSHNRSSTSTLPLDDEPALVFINHREAGLPGFYYGQQYAVARLDLLEDKVRNLYKIRPRPALIAEFRALLGAGKPAQPIMIESRGFFLATESQVLYDIRAESSRGLFVKSFDIQENKPLAEVPLEIPEKLVTHQSSIVTMSGDRNKVAVAIGRDVWVVNSQTGAREQNWQLKRNALQLRMNHLGTRLAVIHPGQSAFERNIGREFVVHNVAEKQVLHSEPTDPILALEFHPQRPQLMVATHGSENRLQVLDADSGKRLSEHSTHYSKALSAAFSKEGNQLAWGLLDTRIELWDLRRVQ